MATTQADPEKGLETPAMDVIQTNVSSIHIGDIADLKSAKREDVDMANEVLMQSDCTAEEVAAVDQKKLLRKIDIRLLPIMFTALTLFTIDKSTLSYSAVMGLQKDTHLTSDQYAWLGSIFSLGYLAANFPCALIIQKVPLSKWVVITMSIWGLILAMMGVGKNFGGLFAIRLLLGFFEASITPVFVIMTGMWYKKHEQAKRLGIWYSGNGMANMLGGLLAWGIAAPDAKTGDLAPWRFMYVITGAITVFLAIVFFVVVPDSQLTAKFLAPAERVAAVERIRSNQQGIGNKKFKLYQAFEVLKDPRTYLYFLIQFVGNIGWGATGTFGSLLIKSLGYNSRQALIQNMPSGACSFVSILVFCYMAERMKDRTLWAGISCLFGVLFGAMLYGFGLDHKAGALAAFQLSHFSVATYILNFSMVSQNTAGHTKKVLTNAILLVGSTTGTLSGPQITKNDPSYKKVKLAMFICPAFILVVLCIIRFINIRENEKRDRTAEQRDETDIHREFLDLTDGENPDFRYAM
ncbi:major facilitator superfamily domain-containing protein [Halenospora varia]|nr:major facilitator superfamily domain-containing protein [Halenospora varia]